MNQKQLDQFKQKIYTPYTEAWDIMKTMRDKEPKDEEFWREYFEICEKFKAKYRGELGDSIYRVLLDVGSEVSRIAKSNV